MRKREVHTTNEFAYDVLNNMMHYNEILVPKNELKDSQALKRLVGKFNDTLNLEERQEGFLIKRNKPLNLLVIYKRKI